MYAIRSYYALYLSVIETPEANSYQQHERDQYWKESPFSNESERGVVIQKNHHSHKQYSDEVKAKVRITSYNVCYTKLLR